MDVYLPPFEAKVLGGTGVLSERIDWGVAALGVPDIWKAYRGERVTVAVLDTGIDSKHPDLQGAIVDACNFTDEEDAEDYNGHGTHCAGIIAARENGLGVVGVAPGAGILAGKVLDSDGAGSSEWIYEGVQWAIHSKADIISMSLGSDVPDYLLERAVKEAMEAGVFVICAAGNDGWGKVDFPGAYPETIAVAASDIHNGIADFSSRGREVDVAAPGKDITSTWCGQKYAKISGTSMACPFVAGVGALALSKHKQGGGGTPMRTLQEVREHLQKTCIDIADPGFDGASGWGLINPRKSVLGEDVNIGPKPPQPVLRPKRSIWDWLFGKRG